ncbi:conserved hypothetical protein [Candida albicans WO-1]|uniref:Uncharacterized protein n=1 Tax=Candida albicans (strain WO-1) TaxID=294748 RepID=C4YMM7_CANAW|nr:conserved hypothetical protein [Candida albicans WO-1]
MVYSKSLILPVFISIFLPWAWIGFQNTRSSDIRPTKSIPVSINFEKDSEYFNFPDLVAATQIQIDSELRYIANSSVNVQLVDNLNNPKNHTKYSVDLVLSRDNSLGISSDGLKGYVLYSYDAIHSNDLPYLIVQTILYHLLKFEIPIEGKAK